MLLATKVIFQQPFSHCKWISDDAFFPILSFLIVRFIVIFSNRTVEKQAGKPTDNIRIIQ